ncbi:MAG: hypothetical protein ABSF67_04415 [Roseiarcus sp.]|jgi:hypothetical protein
MTNGRLDDLVRLLGLDSRLEATVVWEEIESVLPKIRALEDTQERFRRDRLDVQKAKRDLAVIAGVAHRLAVLLANEPLRRVLILGEEGLGRLGPFSEIGGECLGAIDMKETVAAVSASNSEPAKFIDRLEEVAARAKALARDDGRFRTEHGLSDPSTANMRPVNLLLWPFLFDVWRRAGKKLAETLDGPLYRFAAFVHQELGLEPPNSSAFRSAVSRQIPKRHQM